MNYFIQQIFMTQVQLKNKNQEAKQGFAVLTAIMFLAAVAASVAASVAFLSLGNNLNGFAFGQSLQAQYISNACAESVMHSILEDENYAGDQDIVFEFGQCQVLPVIKDGQNYIIKIATNYNNYINRLELGVYVPVDPLQQIKINSWVQKADFN